VTQPRAGSQAINTAVLSVDATNVPRQPLRVADVGEENVVGQFSAVVNIHGCNLKQIEVALETNEHEVDPHPLQEGAFLKRHPVYIVCFDPMNRDETGRPKLGEPLELDLDTTRRIFAKRYAWVSPDAPPTDASHIRVPGMHHIAELDERGNPTGRIVRGSHGDVQGQNSVPELDEHGTPTGHLTSAPVEGAQP
jgi:hypothetical protein